MKTKIPTRKEKQEITEWFRKNGTTRTKSMRFAVLIHDSAERLGEKCLPIWMMRVPERTLMECLRRAKKS